MVMMLGFVVAVIGHARGLTADETAAVYNAVQIIMAKKSWDITTITPRQAWAVLNYAVEAVIEQSRGSATGTAADPTAGP